MIASVLAQFGLIAIGIFLLVLARLCRRLGEMTHARPRYVWLYLAALWVWLGAIIKLFFIHYGLAEMSNLQHNTLYVVLGHGLPALGLTIALMVAWYYWSWLLAERD